MEKEEKQKIVMNPVIFRDSSAGMDFYTTSTMTSEKTEEKDGVKYFVIDIEVSSASHPFYTGKDHVVDSAGRVDKFKQRVEKRQNSK